MPTPPPAEMTDFEITNVVLYARDSSDKQVYSTRDQIDRCLAHCEELGYRVARIFSDEELSGDAVITRRGVRELIEAAFDGEFDRVVVEDLSRISCDRGDVAHLYKRLRFLDIELESVTEGVIDELDMGLKVTRNARFLKELGDKIRRGNLAAVLLGGIPGAAVYGYDMVRRFDEGGEPIRGVRAVNEGEAAVVREMFKRCAAGESSQAICGRLNARGVPAPKGGRWVPPTLTGQAAARTGILRRTLYKGVVTYYRRQFRTHPETGRRVAVLRKLEEWIAVPAPEFAIVEENLFEAAQQQLAARAHRWAKRVRQNAVLTDTERTARVAAYERERQAGKREAMGRGRPLVSQKLFCAAHDEPMRTIRSRLYNCPACNCPNRNLQLDRDLMPLVLESLYGFDADAQLSDLSRFDDWRKALEEQVEVLSRALERERDEIGHVLDTLGRKQKLQSVAPWFEERELRVRRLAHELGEAEEHLRLTAPMGPGERVAIARAYRAELARLVMDDGPGPPFLVGTRLIRPWVERFRLTAQWNENALPEPGGSRWKRSVETRYDLYELLKALRPRRV